jgi:hypothetical protein
MEEGISIAISDTGDFKQKLLRKDKLQFNKGDKSTRRYMHIYQYIDILNFKGKNESTNMCKYNNYNYE